MRKTIILLSSKRSGSTAIFKCFQKHSKVKIPHFDQKIENWEIQFWSLASLALRGNIDPFRTRLKLSFPKINFQLDNYLNDKKIFEIWNNILDECGGTVFDKSPQYLGNIDAFNLLEKYISKGNNVKIFSLIRDPRDTITSQYELWRDYSENDSLEKREKFWIKQYSHLEELRKKMNIPLFNYEQIVSNPKKYISQIYKFCEIDEEINTWKHIKPVSIGRYSTSIIINRKKWKFSNKLNAMILRYNYNTSQLNFLQKVNLTFLRIFTDFKRNIPLKLKLKIKNIFK